MKFRLSVPSEPRPQPPRAAVSEAAIGEKPAGEAERLGPEELLRRVKPLLANGLDHLKRNVHRLPRVEVNLLRLEGETLAQKAEQSMDPTEMASISVRIGRWYVDVRLLRTVLPAVDDPTPEQIETLDQAGKMLDMAQNEAPNAEQPNGRRPIDANVVDAVKMVVDVAKQLVHGQADLRKDMNARFDRVEKRIDRVEGHTGQIVGDRYEDRVRDQMDDMINKACGERALIRPQSIALVWTDRPGVPDGAVWSEIRRELGLASNFTPLRDCDFIYRLDWPEDDSQEVRIPPLLLVGEITIQVDHGILKKVVGHQQELAARPQPYLDKFPARTVICGDRFTDALAAEGGPAAVARAGSGFVDLPADREAAGARRLNVDGLADLLQEWAADGQDTPLTQA